MGAMMMDQRKGSAKRTTEMDQTVLVKSVIVTHKRKVAEAPKTLAHLGTSISRVAG